MSTKTKNECKEKQSRCELAEDESISRELLSSVDTCSGRVQKCSIENGCHDNICFLVTVIINLNMFTLFSAL